MTSFQAPLKMYGTRVLVYLHALVLPDFAIGVQTTSLVLYDCYNRLVAHDITEKIDGYVNNL